MSEILRQLLLPDGILFLPFVVGCMGSLTFGIVGSYVTARGISYVGTGISHAVLGGIGGAVFLSHLTGWGWITPTLGALMAAMAAACIIGSVILRHSHKADSVITAVMVIGMSAGLLFLARTPGYFEPMSVLFGNILLVSVWDIWVIGAINLAVVLVGVLLYSRLLTVCFDEEFARLRGIHADVYFMLLLLLTALTTVVMMKIVGVVMVIALLTLPSMTAGLFSRKLWHCMLGATILCGLYVTFGLAISYAADLPSGPVIVVLAGAVHLVGCGFVRFTSRHE